MKFLKTAMICLALASAACAAQAAGNVRLQGSRGRGEFMVHNEILLFLIL